MVLKNCLIEYEKIKDDCAITTASCDHFAPFLFNMLKSLEKNFRNHPKVYVFDIGLSRHYITELSSIPWVRVVKVPAFVPHWRLCYTWKPYVWNYPKERYILQLDAGLVVLKSLFLWFLAIKKDGYLVFYQGHKLREIAPEDYFERLGVDIHQHGDDKVFAGGIIGFDKSGFAGKAVREALELVKAGWGLGYSEKEKPRIKCTEENIIRKCQTFRHDQTIINLLFRKYSPEPIKVSNEKHIPIFKPHRGDKRPFLWSSRRKKSSLMYYPFPIGRISFRYFLNRIACCIGLMKTYLRKKRVLKSG